MFSWLKTRLKYSGNDGQRYREEEEELSGLIVLLIVIPILSVNQVRFELSNCCRKPIQVIFSLEEWCHEC